MDAFKTGDGLTGKRIVQDGGGGPVFSPRTGGLWSQGGRALSGGGG